MTRTATELDVYEAAYVAGGPDRVVDAALVALVRSGRVRVHSPGELATAELTRRHPVEAAVLDAVGPSGHRSAETIRWRALKDARLTDLGQKLRADGLVAGSRPIAAIRRGTEKGQPTRAGKRLLAELDARYASGPDEWRVALGGRQAMADRALCASIFEQPRTTDPVSRRSYRREQRAAQAADPGIAAARTHLAALGGGAALGFGGDGGGDGGGGGGGDS
jgi:hypothetical protein